MVKIIGSKKEAYAYIDKIADNLTVDDLAKIMGLPPIAEMEKRTKTRNEPRVVSNKKIKE
ncbi:hypothetical protein YK48G_19880 [Lentilactobacillus fungorum]|uniref:Uncharacterized protein n=1 Tax=Lentilactobacillus fungorum TaxID=2201250 RepID=A0ABQ3W0L5_9LACO|nr:hypothetical protein [Lentilactobacillus fungorum]GHP14563.1 hypothetical protein YK48G_19880 [Lentilactobacillus fungorum]